MKASINLAKTFHLGIGVKPDAAMSYMWLQVAVDGGEDVGEALYTTGLEISERQLDQARQQAMAWRVQHHLEVAPSTVASSNSRVSSNR
jgi:TPR repeat protein